MREIIYITGLIDGPSARFGTFNFAGEGAFIAKYDRNGKIIWINAIEHAVCYSVCTDNFGNCYIAGVFDADTARFGNTTLLSVFKANIFIAKLNSKGEYIWAEYVGGAYEVKHLDIASNLNYNFLYIIGAMSATGGYFISKYDLDGNYLWMKDAVCQLANEGYALDLDNEGNIYTTGFFTDYIKIGGVDLYSSGNGRSPFVAKYNSSGNLLWAKRPDESTHTEASALSVFPSGGCVITGKVSGPSTHDIFISRYDDIGNRIWNRNLKDNKNEAAYGIATTNDGNIYVTGFNGGDSIMGLFHTQLFITALDASGTELWSFSAGSDEDIPLAFPETGRGITTDDTALYLTGTFKGNTEFKPYTLNTRGSADVFIAKMALSGALGYIDAVATKPVIYPNPTHNRITIDFSSNQKRRLQILSVDGGLVKDIGFWDAKRVSLDLEGFSEGLYLLNVYEGKIIWNVKFAKQ